MSVAYPQRIRKIANLAAEIGCLVGPQLIDHIAVQLVRAVGVLSRRMNRRSLVHSRVLHLEHFPDQAMLVTQELHHFG
jgi:hypothetical protein